MIPVLTPYYGFEEIDAVNEVLQSNFLNEGKNVREFEKNFANFVGAKYCVATTSGSMALYHALLSLTKTIPSSMPTIVPTYMGIFVAHALKQVEVNPMIADIDENGLLTDLHLVPDAFYVHANGRVHYDIGIKIEDCSQAIHHHTKNAISCYSFAPTKHMTTFGQGGAVCCDNKEVYEKLARIKDHGRIERLKMLPVKDEFEQWGTNMKMTEAQAGFGIEQLKKLPKRLARFEQIYGLYKDELNNVGFLSTQPKWQVEVLVDYPDKFINYLRTNNISANRLHKPIHLQPEFEFANTKKLGQSEDLYNHGVFLPSTTNLRDDEIIDICKIIRGFQ